MIYKTSLDKLAKGITIGISIIFAILILSQFFFVEIFDLKFALLWSICLFSIYLSTFLFRPLNYETTDVQLIIHRPIFSVSINKAQITSVELVNEEKISGYLRITGVGGLFGYYGKFWNSKIGWMTWYATRRNNYVLIKLTSNKKIILTPDDPEKFVANFNS